MTFSIVGRCKTTGQLGIAISSSSIAVGARCPWVQAGVGVVATQNITLPSLGHAVLAQLQATGANAEDALKRALETDSWRQYRQVTVVDANGMAAHHSGAESLGIYNAVAGEQCVAAGNLLSSPEVITAMVQTFEASGGQLAERLLAAMRAAMDAGGEVGPVHSAAIKVAGDVSWPMVDLRVDWSEDDPIQGLQTLWKAYAPQMQDYLTRALNPTAAPSYGVPGDE